MLQTGGGGALAPPRRHPWPLRLRGGMGLLGMTYPHYVEQWDGEDDNCRCMMGCRCAHCWKRNQGEKNDRNILPTFVMDNMLDVGDAPPDTLPSWPPPHGPGTDVVRVQDPNSTALADAIFGAPDADEQRWLRESGRLPAQEGSGEVRGLGERELSEDTGASASSSSWQWQGRNASCVPETRRVVVDAGIWTWEHDKSERTRIGNWYKVEWRRALHVEGHCRWERRAEDGGDWRGAGVQAGRHATRKGGGGADGGGPVDAKILRK